MKILYKISAAVLGMAATIALVQPQIAVGLSDREVGEVAQEITVRIDGPANGSGAIVGKRDNIYTVLTNCHVIKEPGTYTIVTHSGRRYRVNANPSMCQPGGIDLAMLRFTSTRRYRVANLGNSSQLAVGDKVYGSGWGGRSRYSPERRYRLRPGNITGRDPQAREGYTLAHTSQTEPGMSGGPILDEQGNVVGINGQGYKEPNTGQWEFLGIAINTYKSWEVAVLRSEERSTPPPDNPSEDSRNTPPPSPPAPRRNSDNRTAYYSPINYVLAKTLKGHSSLVSSVAFSPDGQLLASSNYEWKIEIWNLGSGRLVRTLTGHSNLVNSVAISPDGQLLTSGSSDKTIKIWNLGSGKLVKTLNNPRYGQSFWSVAISPDGQLLASGSLDRRIKIWNLGNLGSDRSLYSHTITGHSGLVNSVAFSPDGQLLASGSADKTIKIWNLSNYSLVYTLIGHSEWINSVAISPDGQLLASGSDDKTIKIWNLRNGSLVRTINGHSSLVNSVAISPDGQLLASGSKDHTIKIWNLRNGSLVQTLTGHSAWVNSVVFSPDGQTIASGGGCWGCNIPESEIKIWRAQGR